MSVITVEDACIARAAGKPPGLPGGFPCCDAAGGTRARRAEYNVREGVQWSNFARRPRPPTHARCIWSTAEER